MDGKVNKANQVLAFLRGKGNDGATGKELIPVTAGYGTYINILRKQGHRIRAERTGVGNGQRYFLEV